jgi:predicted amidohydrolase
VKSTLRVACAQTGSIAEDARLDETLDRARDWIEAAAERGAEIVMFPELFHAPFFPRELRRDVADRFIAPDGRELSVLRTACQARGIAAILPIAEKAGAFLYNAAVYIDASGGNVGIYRKTHIPAYLPTDRPGGTGSFEKLYFTPGEALPLFEIEAWRFGLQICNDRLYPEASRVLALKGAQILFMPISYSTYDAAEQRRANWDAILRARAIENAAFVAACNRVGIEGPRHHLGLSMIVSPEGRVLATASDTEEELIVADLEAADLERARFGMPWWRDRRPNLYAPLAELEPGLSSGR